MRHSVTTSKAFMSVSGHLELCKLTLSESQEWPIPLKVWIFVQAVEGLDYPISPSVLQQINPNDVIAGFMNEETRIRASRVRGIKIAYFQFRPDLLSGFFSLADLMRLHTRTHGTAHVLELIPSSAPLARTFSNLNSADPPLLLWLQ